MIHRLRLTSRIRCRFDDRFKWEVSGLKMTSARSRQDVCVRHFMQYGMHMYAYWYCLFTVHFHCTDVFILRIVFSGVIAIYFDINVYRRLFCPSYMLRIVTGLNVYATATVCTCWWFVSPRTWSLSSTHFEGSFHFCAGLVISGNRKGRNFRRTAGSGSSAIFPMCEGYESKKIKAEFVFIFHYRFESPAFFWRGGSRIDGANARWEWAALELYECVEWSIGLIIHSRLTQVTMMTCPFRQMDWDGCNSWPQWVRIVCA